MAFDEPGFGILIAARFSKIVAWQVMPPIHYDRCDTCDKPKKQAKNAIFGLAPAEILGDFAMSGISAETGPFLERILL